MKKLKKTIIEKLGQRLADYYIDRLKSTNEPIEVNFWAEQAYKLDLYATENGVYLN